MDNEKVYNNLYPKPEEKLCEKLNAIVKTGKGLRLGIVHDFAIGNKYLQPIMVKNAIKAFHQYKCKGCAGSHQFIIAGGYASYLANLTDSFTDIDIFIDCRSFLDEALITTNKYKIETYKNVSTISFNLAVNKPAIQFIQVNFDIEVSKEDQTTNIYRDLMTIYVLAKFDLPICRVAVKIPLNKSTKIGEIINLAAINLYKEPTSEERMLKYLIRKKTTTTLQPPSLKVTIIFNLINKFC